MKKLYSFVTISVAVTLSSIAALMLPQTAFAATAAPSAVFVTPTELHNRDDKRAQLLRSYLESKNSPLAPYAETFVLEADKNNIDWKLVAAISGLESSYGVHIPANSYNGWGYGVYGDNVRRFDSWDDGIAVVSGALRNDYMNKWNAKTIPEIGRLYAASPTWAVRVQSFMDSINAYEVKKQNENKLTLSL